MKKIYVIVQKKDIVSALESLRESGSVHVEHEEPLTGYQLEERRQEVEILEQAIKILDSVETEKDGDQQIASDWTEIVNTVLELSAEIDHYKENISKRHNIFLLHNNMNFFHWNDHYSYLVVCFPLFVARENEHLTTNNQQ